MIVQYGWQSYYPIGRRKAEHLTQSTEGGMDQAFCGLRFAVGDRNCYYKKRPLLYCRTCQKVSNKLARDNEERMLVEDLK